MDDSSFLGCPQEILDLIFESIQPTDFYALCLVSRAMRRQVEHLLYSRISWTWTFGWPTDGSHGVTPVNQKIPPIVPFMRTISDRPELALSIREIILKGDSLSRIAHFYRGAPPALPSLEGMDTFDKMVSHIDLPEEDRAALVNGLREGAVEAFVALLLAHALELRHLRLEENYLRDMRFVNKLLARAVRRGSSSKLFRSLSEVHFPLSNDMRYRADSRHTASTSTCLSLFYLPSLEGLTVSIDNPQGPLRWPLARPPDASKLTWLDLGMLREGHLGKVLSATPNLRTLRWGWFHDPRLQDRFVTSFVDLDKITSDLLPVRRTLTDLAITAAADGTGMEWPVIRVKGSMAGLVGFEALKSLELPLPFLVGSFSHGEAQPPGPSLPRNLETVIVTDDLFMQHEWDWDPVDWWELFGPWLERAAWKPFAPRLRQLRFVLRELEEQDFTASLTTDLVRLGERVGLHVEVMRGGLGTRRYSR
jgi:hypothetical protein